MKEEKDTHLLITAVLLMMQMHVTYYIISIFLFCFFGVGVSIVLVVPSLLVACNTQQETAEC